MIAFSSTDVPHRTPPIVKPIDSMLSPSRLLPLFLLFMGLGVSGAMAQSSHYGEPIAVSHSVESIVPDLQSSAVLKDVNSSGRAVGVDARPLKHFSQTESLQINGSTTIQPVSFRGTGLSSRLNPQSDAGVSNTRMTLYIIGGVLVAGGAVAGILALSGDGGGGPDPIPAPPGRP